MSTSPRAIVRQPVFFLGDGKGEARTDVVGRRVGRLEHPVRLVGLCDGRAAVDHLDVTIKHLLKRRWAWEGVDIELCALSRGKGRHDYDTWLRNKVDMYTRAKV